MDNENIKNHIFVVKNLSVWYKNFQALKNISTNIEERNITALIGASGSGKSSFLRSLNRMLDLVSEVRTEGEVNFYGNNIFNAHTDTIALRRKVGMVFQNPTPFPKSIYENVSYGLEIQGVKNNRKKPWFHFGNGKIYAEDVERSNDPLDQAVFRSLKEAALWEEVKDRLHTSAYGLSGGQQQRLCIARAIAVRPEVLLLDEPCSELDPISTRRIEELLISLKQKYTIVIVTHNMHQARRISDYVGFFHLGDLVEFDNARTIFESPRQALTKEYITGAFG